MTFKLLLIEDDKVDQMAFARCMAQECPEFKCTIASSAKEAKNILEASIFDVVVTDFHLGDGLAFDIFPLVGDAPIILTTASGNEEVAVKALKSGAYDYLVKDADRHYLKLLRFTLIRSIERKKAEYQLRLLSETVHTMSDGVCISDEEKRIVFVNRSFCNAYGYSEEEAYALRHTDLWVDPQSSDRVDSTGQNDFWEGESLHRRKNGETFDVSYSQSRLLVDGRVKNVMVIRDITERKRFETAIRQSEKIAAVGQLAAGIAHEINNPLCVILGAVQGIQYRTKELDPIIPLLKSVERETHRCSDLVKSLLSFSRTSNAQKGPADLNAAIEEALTLIQGQLKMTRIKPDKSLAPNLPFVLMSTNQLQQVFINLASNAIQSMKQEGLLSIQTGLELSDNGPMAFLKIRDTGPGIPAAILPRIFEPFFTTKAPGKGTGLGLAMIHEIVKRCDGRIDVQSNPGLTEFTVYLPVQKIAVAA